MKRTLILIICCTEIIVRSYAQIYQGGDSLRVKEIDKEFLGIKLESPYTAFKSYKLERTQNNNGKKEYYSTDNDILSFKSFKVKGIYSLQFTLGKLSSFSFDFSPQPEGSFDTLKKYFMLKYGNPTIRNKGFDKVQEQNYDEEDIWETGNYKLKLIKIGAYPDGSTFNKKYFFAEMQLTSKRLEKEGAEQLARKLQLDSKEATYEERVGKGSGVFVPDINSSIKLLLVNTTITNFEKLLPSFSVSMPDTLFDYNKITDEYDLFNSIMYTYTFTYKKIQLSAEVGINKNKVIKKIEYLFVIDPGIRFALQRSQNGLIINELMTEMVSTMGLNECIVYDNTQKIHLNEYSSTHFSIQKY